MNQSDDDAFMIHEISCEGEVSHEAFTQFVVLKRWDCDEYDDGHQLKQLRRALTAEIAASIAAG